MGEDGIADDDLQVVSGERDLENLDPKERVKLENKRGLIRAGMGAAADEAEETGFEVAKASGAAMAMLGKRYKPKFAVDGLDVEDDREYGSDQVGGRGGGFFSLAARTGPLKWGIRSFDMELLLFDGLSFEQPDT